MKSRRRILAVDDNEINLTIMRTILGGEYDLRTARSGEDALESMARDKPDLILLDIMMPGIDGYETCRRIRASEAMCNTMVILVSSKESTEERLEGYQAGANDYITKPFDKDEMLAKVRVFLRLKAAEEVDMLKTNVLSLLDHEFCAPLTGIIPAGQMLSSDTEMSKEDRRKWGKIVLESGQRLLTVAERGLLLCRLREESMEIDNKTVDIGQQLHDLSGKLSFSLQGSIRCNVQENASSKVEADERLIETALRCLLEGAIQFSDQGGEISIDVIPAIGCTSIMISIDRSIMTRQQRDRLFEPMIGAMGGDDTMDSGFGDIVGADIAFSLARAVFIAHGGSIVAYREGERGIVINAKIPVHVSNSDSDQDTVPSDTVSSTPPVDP